MKKRFDIRGALVGLFILTTIGFLVAFTVLVLRCFQWNKPGCLGSIGGCNLSKCSSGC